MEQAIEAYETLVNVKHVEETERAAKEEEEKRKQMIPEGLM